MPVLGNKPVQRMADKYEFEILIPDFRGKKMILKLQEEYV